jgi:hypothetical protein
VNLCIITKNFSYVFCLHTLVMVRNHTTKKMEKNLWPGVRKVMLIQRREIISCLVVASKFTFIATRNQSLFTSLMTYLQSAPTIHLISVNCYIEVVVVIANDSFGMFARDNITFKLEEQLYCLPHSKHL